MPSENNAYPDILWAGTEHALELAMLAHQQVDAAIQAAITAGTYSQFEEEEVPYLLSMQGDVAILAVRGPLVNRDSVYNRYFGVTSYSDIRRAAIYAASKAEVKGILLDVDSGGGAVNGLSDTASLLATIDKQIKPIWTHSEGTMASAAYWLGSVGRRITASKTSLLGSIGVITTHMEYSKQLKESGVGVNVVRAGKFKALINSVEAPTKAALDQLQAQLDEAYKVFIDFVAERRGVTPEKADEEMGQGREFFGQAALGVKLVDGITTFDAAMSAFAKKLLDSKAGTQNNYRNTYQSAQMPQEALTEQQIAAMAAGASAQSTEAAAAAAAAATAAAAAAAAATTSTPAAAAPAPAAAAPAPAPAADPTAALVATITANAEQLVSLRSQVAALTAERDSLKATSDGLLAIASQSLKNLKVAMGATNVDVSALTAAQVLAEHATQADAFQKRFPVGGVAAVGQGEATKSAAPDANYLARVQATRAR